MDSEVAGFMSKAMESLASAESELINGRYNSCANRAYYACFQAAVATIIQVGIRPIDPSGKWGHDFVQARFAGDLINRRHRFPADLRKTLDHLILLRQTADYRPDAVNEKEAKRAVQRARTFVQAVLGEGVEL